jgi:hypothetical protein
MKKLFSLVLVSMLLTTIACDDDDDGKQACDAYATKCPAGSAGIQSCSADRINDAANGGDVEDCIQGAADCNAANTCLASLK